MKAPGAGITGGAGYLRRSTLLAGSALHEDTSVGIWMTGSAGERSEHRARVQLLTGHGRLRWRRWS